MGMSDVKEMVAATREGARLETYFEDVPDSEDPIVLLTLQPELDETDGLTLTFRHEMGASVFRATEVTRVDEHTWKIVDPDRADSVLVKDELTDEARAWLKQLAS